jgi:hypothetical protein
MRKRTTCRQALRGAADAMYYNVAEIAQAVVKAYATNGDFGRLWRRGRRPGRGQSKAGQWTGMTMSACPFSDHHEWSPGGGMGIAATCSDQRKHGAAQRLCATDSIVTLDLVERLGD